MAIGLAIIGDPLFSGGCNGMKAMSVVKISSMDPISRGVQWVEEPESVSRGAQFIDNSQGGMVEYLIIDIVFLETYFHNKQVHVNPSCN